MLRCIALSVPFEHAWPCDVHEAVTASNPLSFVQRRQFLVELELASCCRVALRYGLSVEGHVR